MSFQYNSKTKQFKVRIWEVLITSLLSTAKIAKDTSLQLYLKTTIVPDQEYQPNPALRRKSEVFRLNPSENNEPISENQSTDMFVWKGKEARLEFKNSLTLVYEDISKELVATSSLDISISVKRKKSFMTSKHKQQLQDPVLASVNLYMKEAVRKLMKDKYETQRHDIPGITRQAFSLDSVVTDNMRRRNGIETSSAPLERIRLRSLEGVKQTAVNNRCASDGDVHEIPGKNLRKSTQSVTSDVSSNVWLEDPVTESSSLESVTSHVTTPSPQVEVKISSQLTYNEPSFQMQMPKPEKTKDALHEKTHRGRNLIQKSRQKIRSTGHGLIPSSMKSSVTVVTAMDEEERSVGSPSEEIEPYGAPYISNLANRQHSYSTGSLVEVDESPSPSRYRRQNRFASTPDKRRYKPEHYKSSEKLGSRSIAVQMDPKDKNVSISMEKLAPRAEMKHSYGTSYNRRKTSETSCGSRPSILRKLVYDETTFVPNEMNNPCFVND
nr:uncharacterized protein LOC100181982 [Ciona intestinalis]|eukprot:XP_018671129.1 uncharacterized protein LOC100181982 [Ciona intestinalis]